MHRLRLAPGGVQRRQYGFHVLVGEVADLAVGPPGEPAVEDALVPVQGRGLQSPPGLGGEPVASNAQTGWFWWALGPPWAGGQGAGRRKGAPLAT